MLAVFIVIGVVVVLIGIVLLIGSRLPVGHQASRTAELASPPQEVWKTITSVEDYPSWRPNLKRVELLPTVDAQMSWREYERQGKITFEAIEVEEPRLFRTRIADKNLPYGGTWTYAITPAGTGTTLTVTEDGEIYNPLFRFISRYIIGYTATMDRYLKALTTKLA